MTHWLPIVLAAAAAALLVAPLPDGAWRLAATVAPPQRNAPSPVAAIVIAVATAAWFAVGPAGVALIGVGGVLLHRSSRRRSTLADEERERTRALDALTMLAAELRVGRTPADAFDAAAGIACGPSAVAFTSAAAAARLGGEVASALSAPDSAVAVMLQALAVCWRVCSDAGNGLADAVDRLVEGLRAAEAQRRDVAAELAGPRATAQLLAVLPLVGVALSAALGAHPLELLLGTPFGLCCLVVGLALDGLGVVWTMRLTERAMP